VSTLPFNAGDVKFVTTLAGRLRTIDRARQSRHDPSMQIAARSAAVGVLSLLSACFLANSGADKKIGEAVHNLNDQARWGRINDAALLAMPDYRETFLRQHRQWGTDIQLADTEVVNIQLGTDAENASAFVTYSWYAMSDMTLHETTLRQLWKAHRSTFALVSESVVRGDPSLLASADAPTSQGAQTSEPPPPR
jgi:hypothetical protein